MTTAEWLIVDSFLFLVYTITAFGGYVLGRNESRLQERIKHINDELRTRKEEEDESSIIETTPQLIRQKVSKGDVDPDESAVITTKTPEELRQAKQAKLDRELDRLTS